MLNTIFNIILNIFSDSLYDGTDDSSTMLNIIFNIIIS